jgi:membrane fusion protein, multidrug efflux system
MNRTRIQLASLFLLLAAAALCGCKRSQADTGPKATPAVHVQTARAKTGEATRSIVLPATVLPYQQATLYAKVAGYLKSIAVDKGDAVKEGDILADIEVPELLADLGKSKAELAVAKLEYERVRGAQAKAPDLVVPQTVDNAAAKWEVAKANLERIETLLHFAKIVAPFSGVVTRRFVDPGAFIPAATSGSAAQNAAILTIADYSRVRVQVGIPESEVLHIEKGIGANIALEELPGIQFNGPLTRYAHTLDEATRTMLAEIELDNPQGRLRPGMYANVRLFVERKQGALLIPLGALLTEKTRTFVFTITANHAKKTPVQIGFSDQTHVEIVEGLAPGQPVVLLGKLTLGDGQPVSATEAK